jgi:hypothetical protein
VYKISEALNAANISHELHIRPGYTTIWAHPDLHTKVEEIAGQDRSGMGREYMKVVKENDHWVIASGQRKFCFFVDHDRSSWTNKFYGGKREFATLASAEEALVEIRRRMAMRRKKAVT